jgi:hypothetical protein
MQYVFHKRVGNIPVLCGQRIDGRINDSLFHGQVGFSVVLAGDDHNIITEDERLDVIPDTRIGIGDIDVTSPYPGLYLFIVFDKGQRLGIMDNHTIMIEMSDFRKTLVCFQIKLFFITGQIYGLSLEGIVKFFGDIEKIGRSGQNTPSGIHAHVIQQQYEIVQNFSHAPPVGRGIDVHNVFVDQFMGFLIDVPQNLFSHYGKVVVHALHLVVLFLGIETVALYNISCFGGQGREKGTKSSSQRIPSPAFQDCGPKSEFPASTYGQTSPSVLNLYIHISRRNWKSYLPNSFFEKFGQNRI